MRFFGQEISLVITHLHQLQPFILINILVPILCLAYTSQRYKRSYDNVVCFQCGRLGHYRSFCPDNNKTHTVQIPNVQGQR